MTDLADFLTTEPSPGDPVVRQLPKSVTALGNLNSYLDTVPSSVASPQTADALRRVAYQRIARGQLPPGAKEAPALLAAGQTLQAQAPVPERGTGPLDILGNAALDVRDIFTSIPKLPFILYDQIKQLPQAPAMLGDALGRGDFKAVSQVPGINLIPGAYTLGNILSGDFGELARHPVMTGLDIAPALSAKVFAPASPATLASRSRLPQLGRLLSPSETAYATLATEGTGRITAQGLAEQAAIFDGAPKRSILQLIGDETPVGRLKDSAIASAKSSRASQYLRSNLSPEATNISRLASHFRQGVYDVLNPNSVLWDPTNPRGLKHSASANPFKPDAPAIEGVFDFERKYATEEGIAQVSGGKYTSLKDWEPRRMEITKEIQVSSPQDVARKLNLEPFEIQMIDEARQLADQVVAPYTIDYALDPAARTDGYSFAWVDIGGSRELYPLREAEIIEKVRLKARIATEYDKARNATSSGLLDPDTLAFIKDQRIPVAAREDVLVGNLWALRDAGVDVNPVIAQIRQGGTPFDIATTLQQQAQINVYTLQDIVDSYTRRGPSGRRLPIVPTELRTFDALVKNGLYREAWKELDNFFLRTKRSATLPPSLASMDMDMVRDALRQYADRKNTMSRLDAVGKRAQTLVKQVSKVEKSRPPARFYPDIKVRAMPEMVKFARALGEGLAPGTQLADDLARYVEAEHFAMLDRYVRQAEAQGIKKADLVDPLTGTQIFPNALPTTAIPNSVRSIFANFAGDASRTWMDMKAAGFDPTFVHAVDSSKAGAIPRIMPRPTSPSQVKSRTFDFAPLSDDLVVGLSHQMTEWLVKKQTDAFIDTISRGSQDFYNAPFTATREELERALMPLAEHRAKRRGTSTTEEMAGLIEKQFAKFEPNQYLNFPKRGATQGTQELYIDKAMLSTIEQLAAPAKVSALWDPVMGIFRTSVLTLSPRWQIYNLLGNALQVTIGSGFGWMRQAQNTREILKYLRDPHSAGTVAPAVMDKLSESFRLSLSQLPRELAEYNYRTGQGLARMFKGEVPGPLAAATKGFTSLTEKLTNLNGFVDDAFRVMTYLDEYDRAATREAGKLSKIQAAGGGAGKLPLQASAEQAVRKIMYSWDAMTPFERQTMRYIFPFYGFMSHVMRFAYRYSVDHPIRMAVTAAFARNEMEDWNSGLPERLRSMVLFGEEDGKATGVNVAGWNPFGDIANTLTLTGWLSQVNPIFSTIAEQFGIDPRTGQANLYPESSYDPVSGRLTLATRNPLTALVENLIPQTQMVTDALGLNENLSNLERSDPDAAMRLKLSSFGVPNLYREVDLPVEAMKAEGARQNAYKQALSNVLANPDRRSPYPALNALRDQILQLQSENPEALRKYTPAGMADIQSRIVTSVGG